MGLIERRSPDWWFFTLIPLFIFGIIIFLAYLSGISDLSLLITQQLFFYSLILSSTEIGIRFRINQHEEEKMFKGCWSGFTILITSAILLPTTYLLEKLFNENVILFLIISSLCTLGSVWMSNKNKYSGIPDYSGEKKETQENFSKKVESTTEEYKGVKV